MVLKVVRVRESWTNLAVQFIALVLNAVEKIERSWG